MTGRHGTSFTPPAHARENFAATLSAGAGARQRPRGERFSGRVNLGVDRRVGGEGLVAR